MSDDSAHPAGATPPRDTPNAAPSPGALGEGEFRLLADNLPTLCWIADATGYITWYNRRWHEYCGTTPEQMEGWGWQSVHDPDVLPDVMTRWTGSIATGEPFEMTFPLRGADGVFRPFLTRIAPVHGPDRRIIRWVGTNVDVSRQVELERAHRSAERRAADVLQSMGEGYVLIDREFRIAEINAEGVRIDGRPREEIIGRHVLDLWPESADLPTWPAYQAAMADGQPQTLEYQHLSDVHDVWLEVRIYPGEAGLAVFYRDVSARKQAEIALAESGRRQAALRAEQEAILSQLDEGVIVTDREGRISFVNEAAARLHGVRELAVAAEDWAETYHLLTLDGRPHPVEDLPLARAFHRGETVVEARWRIRRPDGTEVLAIGTAKPLVIDGERAGAVLTVRDDTERTRAEENIRASERLLNAVLDALPVGVIIANSAGALIRDNAANRELWGMHRPTASWEEYGEWAGYWPDTGRRLEAGEWAMARALLHGEVVRDELVEAERFDNGERRRFLNNAAPVRAADGEIIGAVVVEVDVTDRLATEQSLREKDAVIRAFYETSNLYTAVLELEADDYCFVTANRETARFYGVDDVAGRRGSEFMPADLLPRMVGALHSAHRKGKAVTLEYPFKVGRQTHWYLSTLAPMPSGANGRPRISVASFDITPRKRAERALKASEERLEAITDSVDQMIWSTRPDGYHDYYNRRWYEFTGMPPGSTDGEEWNGMFHPDDQDRAWSLWRHSLNTGEPYEIEYRLRHRSGEYRWVIGRARAVRDPEGRITRWYGTCTDVHALKVAETALLEESRTLETLNRTGNALAGELDLERLVQMVTDAGVDLTGADYGAFFYSSQEDTNDFALYTLSGARREDFEWMGRPRITDIFHGTFVDKRVIRSDDIATDPHYGKMAPHHGPPRGHLPVRSYLGVPVIGRSGEVIGAMLFAHGEPGRFTERHERLVTGVAAQAAVAIDNARLIQNMQAEVAERTRAEAALRELNATLEARISEAIAEREQAEAQLRQAQKMEAVGQLTGGIAHDFNNLLTVVMGNIDIGRRALSTGSEGIARTRRALDNAQRGAERAAALTQRLLAFARRQPLLPKPINMDRLVQGMSDLLIRALGETIKLEVVTSPGLWRVEADPNQLESALLNLAVNARDAMPGGGRLTVETSNASLEDSYSAAHAEVAPGQYVVIAVSDTGEGMTKDTLDHVFEPFFTTKEVGKGTGLGLSMVYGFVKQSGGHVKIYSEPGAGTTVKIYLPRMLSEADEGPGEEAVDPELAHARETVLVVEDDPDVRQYSSETLRELGYRVLEAEDGAAALRLLERAGATVDLLFTDVVMPGLSGRELADRARDIRPDLKVLFTSGYTRNAISQNGQLQPGMAMIAKPFGFSALARKIRDVLDTGKSGRVLLVSPTLPLRGAEALEFSGYLVDRAANAGEALSRVRSGAGLFDAVLIDGVDDPAAAARLYAELRAHRADLPLLLIAGPLPAAVESRLEGDRCGDRIAPDAADEAMARALSDLGVRCAEAHAAANGAPRISGVES